MNPVNWFEIPVTDIDRAVDFYERVLGTTLTRIPAPVPGRRLAMFPWEPGAANASGALAEGPGSTPRIDGTLVSFQCEDVADELARVEAAGGKVLLPKTSIGEYGFIGHFVDTEGNRVGLHSAR